MTLVGSKAPDFIAPAVLGNGQIDSHFSFSKAVANKYSLIFFYPLDFTFVCPTELIALDNRFAKLAALNVEVLAVSIDSHFTHLAWRNMPVASGGIGPVKFTMVADFNHHIMQAYGMKHPEAGVALRGAFLIDKAQIIQAACINNLPLGRNIEEIIRLFEAIQFTEQHGEVCPAGWNKGKKGMQANSEGVAEYLASNASDL